MLSIGGGPTSPRPPAITTALKVRTIEPMVMPAPSSDQPTPVTMVLAESKPATVSPQRRADAVLAAAPPPDSPATGGAPPPTVQLPPAGDPPAYVPSSALEMPPLPRSAPDPALVEGVFHSGQPIRLRLYVESDGIVSSVDMLSVHELDEPAAERLAAMFRATAFLPGRRHGRDVAAYMDIEIVSLPVASSLHSN